MKTQSISFLRHQRANSLSTLLPFPWRLTLVEFVTFIISPFPVALSCSISSSQEKAVSIELSQSLSLSTSRLSHKTSRIPGTDTIITRNVIHFHRTRTQVVACHVTPWAYQDGLLLLYILIAFSIALATSSIVLSIVSVVRYAAWHTIGYIAVMIFLQTVKRM